MAISYFGGKQKMAEWIYPFIPRDTKTYAEPFSGAFWVYMNIKGDYSHIDTIVYNDINKHMVNLYACMKEYDTFLEYFNKAFDKGGLLYQKGNIDDYKADMKALYYEYKKDVSENNFLDNPPTERPDFDAGVKYAFLITSAFNACYPRAAGCSAFNKDRLKINALLNKLNDEKYQTKFKNITNVENLDFEALIDKYDSEETFFYLDPPYEDKDNKRLDWYGVGDDNAFGRASHERLCKLLTKTKAKWALSYYYFEELEEWLPKDKYRWEVKEFFRSSASFSDNKDVIGQEVLIMNYDMSEEEYNENSKHFKTTTRKKSTTTTKRRQSKTKPSQELVDKVLEQMKLDFEMEDLTSIEELLFFCPKKNLESYLPEVEEVIVESELEDTSGLYESSGLKEVFEEKTEDEVFDANLKGFEEKMEKKKEVEETTEEDDFWED